MNVGTIESNQKKQTNKKETRYDTVEIVGKNEKKTKERKLTGVGDGEEVDETGGLVVEVADGAPPKVEEDVEADCVAGAAELVASLASRTHTKKGRSSLDSTA